MPRLTPESMHQTLAFYWLWANDQKRDFRGLNVASAPNQSFLDANQQGVNLPDDPVLFQVQPTEVDRRPSLQATTAMTKIDNRAEFLKRDAFMIWPPLVHEGNETPLETRCWGLLVNLLTPT